MPRDQNIGWTDHEQTRVSSRSPSPSGSQMRLIKELMTTFCDQTADGRCWAIWEPPGDGDVTGDRAKTRRGLFMAGPTDISLSGHPKVIQE